MPKGKGYSRGKGKRKPRKAWLLVLLAPVLLLSGCVQQQAMLEQTRDQLKQAREQKSVLAIQLQGEGLTAAEANAVQTSLDRTNALIANLEEQEKILMDQIQQGVNDWAGIVSQVLGGVLGIGALAGRRA